MNKMLLIVDPQNDFISGSLPVGGACEAMTELTHFLEAHGNEYLCKVVTTDWHPYRHCSFTANGGEWPAHCVQYDAGAAIFSPLITALHQSSGKVVVLQKGTEEDQEEYSIFKNMLSSERLKVLMRTLHIERIDLCGIAGDVCVLNTLRDGVELFGKDKFCVLQAYCPSIDGGKALTAYLEENNIPVA